MIKKHMLGNNKVLVPDGDGGYREATLDWKVVIKGPRGFTEAIDEQFIENEEEFVETLVVE